MYVFDADDLVRIAGRIEEQATALRARARSLVCAAHQARWHSPAAAAFRDRALQLNQRIQRAANNLDRAAHELRLHAGRVRTVAVAVAAAARLERTAIRKAAHVVEGTVQSLEHAGASLADHL